MVEEVCHRLGTECAPVAIVCSTRTQYTSNVFASKRVVHKADASPSVTHNQHTLLSCNVLRKSQLSRELHDDVPNDSRPLMPHSVWCHAHEHVHTATNTLPQSSARAHRVCKPPERPHVRTEYAPSKSTFFMEAAGKASSSVCTPDVPNAGLSALHTKQRHRT